MSDANVVRPGDEFAAALGEPALHEMPEVSAPPAAKERVIYRASGGRRVAFSVIFLLLLPFFVSLGPMLWVRITHGLWHDALGLSVIAIGFAIVMFLVLVELLHSVRSRVELGNTAVRFTLPSGRGPTPMLRFKTREIAYKDIGKIEVRREVYGGVLAPMMLKGARIVTRGGEKFRLGYVNEANVDPAFPYIEIGERIANRAGVEIVDRGNVRRSMPKKMLGIAASGRREKHSIDEIEMRELNKKHARLMGFLVAGLVVLIGLGIVGDMMQPV
ncbi:MAG: hypothetical protein KDJ45_03720 [Hyphomicrobiaceae bacterium]|nr:hypothetical protein [Hyphomicrobiaceae bacterium]MCC0009558.1 hypothetical protein [Hyphomicrobiaceae bacterium]